MMRPCIEALGGFVLFFLSVVRAQIIISEVPQASCAGEVATGTATFSTEMTLPTGSQRIPAGSFWDQMGAIWVFSTDTDGITFSDLGIPGSGAQADIPPMDISALQEPATGSKTAWTLVVPTVSGANEFDIVFQAVPPQSTTRPNSVPTTTTAATTITGAPVTSSPVSSVSTAPANLDLAAAPARFRRREYPGIHFRKRQSAPATSATGGTFHLMIKGTYPCNLNPSLGLQPGPSITGASNPTVAAQCSKNSISTNAAAWTAYAANKYMSSMLSAAAPAPTAPQVNAATLFGHDVGAQDSCTYSSKCDSIQCGSIADASTGKPIVIQRYLAYTSLVNFNNYLYAVYDALFDSASIGLAGTGQLVDTFFTNPDPPVTWEQILSVLSPLLGMFSAGLGGVGASAAGAVTGVIGSIFGVVTSIGNAQAKPVVDKRFTEFSSIDEFIKQFLQATANGVQSAWQQYVGNASAASWSGSDIVGPDDPNHDGIFGTGIWVDQRNFNTANMQKIMLDNFVRIISYKAINYAWNDSQAFIIYVPYNTPIKDEKGNMKQGGVDQDWCEQNLLRNNDDKILTICDAPGPGMAHLYSATGDNSDAGNNQLAPKGYNAPYDIVPGETFFTSGATHGSVASWLAGDFGYDISKSFQSLSTGSDISNDDITKLSQLKISPETPGFFNLPVCRTLDLRALPAAGGSFCGCSDKAAIGGTSGSTAKFSDNVQSAIMDWISKQRQPNCIPNYESAPSCSGGCPSDIYSG